VVCACENGQSMAWRRLIDDHSAPTLIVDLDIGPGVLKRAYAGVEHGGDVWVWQELGEESRGLWTVQGEPIWTHGAGAPGSMLEAVKPAKVRAGRARRPGINRKLYRVGELLTFLAHHETAVAQVSETEPIVPVLQSRGFAPRTRSGGRPHPGEPEAINTEAKRRSRQRKREGRGSLPRLTPEERRFYRLKGS
jgi:hypothetical protein